MDPLLEVQFSENSGGSSGGINVQCRLSGGCFDARSCHKHSLSQPSPYHLLTPIFTYTSTLDTLLTQIYIHLLSLEHSIHTKIIPPRFEKCILHSRTHFQPRSQIKTPPAIRPMNMMASFWPPCDMYFSISHFAFHPHFPLHSKPSAQVKHNGS